MSMPSERPTCDRPTKFGRQVNRYKRQTARQGRKSGADAKIPSWQGPSLGCWCGGVEGDVVAESLELTECVSLESFGIAVGEVVRAGVVVEGAGVGHGPDRGQDGVLDGDECLLGSAPGSDPLVLRRQVGAVGVGYRQRGGSEGALEVGVTWSGCGRF